MRTTENPPAYTLLRTKPCTAHKLARIEKHNNRSIHVPNANPDARHLNRKPRPVDSLALAIAQRIGETGARCPRADRHIAFEAVLTVSAHCNPMPSNEVFAQRAQEFCDKTWGRANVVATWFHGDEAAPHFHAVVVPICLAPTVGRPRDDEPDKEEIAVSWNVFCGAAEVDDRSPESDHKRRPRKTPRKVKTRRNKVLSGWQTGWHQKFPDYPHLRRGIPSTREAVPPATIRKHHADLEGHAELVSERIVDALAAVKITLGESEFLSKNRSPENLLKLAKKYQLPVIAEHLSGLVVKAKQGIELPWVKKQLAELADAHETLKNKYASARGEFMENRLLIKSVAVENNMLKEELAHFQKPDPDRDIAALSERVKALSDDDFKLLIAARNELVVQPTSTAILRPLPQPKASFGSKGTQLSM